MPNTLSCREFVEFLAEYLEGRLRPDQLVRFNEHLAACPACVSYTRSYRDALRLGRSALSDHERQLPADVPDGLVRAILDARRTRS